MEIKGLFLSIFGRGSLSAYVPVVRFLAIWLLWQRTLTGLAWEEMLTPIIKLATDINTEDSKRKRSQ